MTESWEKMEDPDGTLVYANVGKIMKDPEYFGLALTHSATEKSDRITT